MYILACTYFFRIIMHTKFPITLPRFFLYPLRIGNKISEQLWFTALLCLSDFHHIFLARLLFSSLFHACFFPSFRLLIWFVVSQWTVFPLQYSCIVYNKHVTRIECVTKCDMVTNILFQSNVLCQMKLLRYSGLTLFQTKLYLSSREM
jgi:hypothetical protein